MTRYALTIHSDDRDLWLAMTGRDETSPDVPPLDSVDCMLDAAKRNNLRVTAREIPEVAS